MSVIYISIAANFNDGSRYLTNFRKKDQLKFETPVK